MVLPIMMMTDWMMSLYSLCTALIYRILVLFGLQSNRDSDITMANDMVNGHVSRCIWKMDKEKLVDLKFLEKFVRIKDIFTKIKDKNRKFALNFVNFHKTTESYF